MEIGSKNNKTTSLLNAIFFPNLIISIVALTALSIVLTMVVNRLTTTSLDDRLQTTQRLFLETVSQDYLTGSHALVYRKCKALVSDKLVRAVKIVSPSGQIICDVSADEPRSSWNWINSAIYYDEAQTQIAAQVSLGYSTAISHRIFFNTIFIIIAAIVATALLQLLASRKLAVSVASPISSLANALNTNEPQEITNLTYDGSRFHHILEVAILFDSIRKLFLRIDEYQQQLIAKTRQATVGEVAAQVAHDIRSPLAALESLLEYIGQLPEEYRILLRSATSRIRDIANDLLERRRTLDRDTNTTIDDASQSHDSVTSVWLLSGLIESLISEARFQFRSKIGVEIEANLGSAAYGLFAHVNQSKFKAVLSNLINNSVEAIEEKGHVTVSLRPVDATALTITVADSGKGIPPDILPMLMQEGKTFRKSGGTGLGLYGARTAVESWDGQMNINSNLGSGTTVSIRLPRAPAPSWFVSHLPISDGEHIVILDDDSSVHQVWQSRFDALQPKGTQLNIHHFTTPQELAAWVKDPNSAALQVVYLIDYELIGHKESGLDLIEKFGLAHQSILVTSRHEDQTILERLSKLGAHLLPKGLAPFIPVTSSEKIDFTCVLIDDDPMIHMTWKLAAKKTSHKIAHFTSAAEFIGKAPTFSKGTTIYIDSKLGDGVRGEDLAKEIYALGFQNIYLITGLSTSHFPPMPHIKEVRGKEPPW